VSDDAIEVKLRSWANVRRRSGPWSVTIGEDTFVFPEGTTREQAQSVLDEAIRRAVLKHDGEE
jgi:hypothetical protein